MVIDFILFLQSFNLKPAVVTRPSIQGPKTNLRVAAILEKANAIRQVCIISSNASFLVFCIYCVCPSCSGIMNSKFVI